MVSRGWLVVAGEREAFGGSLGGVLSHKIVASTTQRDDVVAVQDRATACPRQELVAVGARSIEAPLTLGSRLQDLRDEVGAFGGSEPGSARAAQRATTL